MLFDNGIKINNNLSINMSEVYPSYITEQEKISGKQNSNLQNLKPSSY
jgi:hypothetical protein